MPGMDNTGPFGTGPIGRGMGPCGKGQGGRGRGRGFRRGGGAGWGRFYTPLTPNDEIAVLEQQKSWLETQLDAITKRLQGAEKPEE